MSDGFFWDGYLHWARDIEEKDSELCQTGESELYEPIFIRFHIPIGMISGIVGRLEKIFEHLEPETRFRSQVAEIDSLVFLSDFAFDLVDLLIGFQHAVVEKSCPEFFIYRRVAKTQTDHVEYSKIFTVLDVGAPARVNLNPIIVKPAPVVGFLPPTVIGGIIDNDIGYLNRTFRNLDNDKTRISSIWLQARERFEGSPPSGLPEIHIGKILNADDINNLIASAGRNERQAYANMNASLHSRSAYKLPPPIASHGSMVADLAFGNREKVTMQDVPLLAVQLPPESAFDTSGTMSESYIVQAVRWICFWARQNDPTLPVVINISYGILAGQKDGGKFIESQIAKEIDIACKYKDSQKVDVVFAFGNSRNEKQVAEVLVAPGPPEKLTWIIPPDNPAPAFVEIRAVGQSRLADLPNTLTVSLMSPDKKTSTSLAGSAGTRRISANPPVTMDGGTVSVRIYNIPLRGFCDRPSQPGYTLAAVGPTRMYGHKLPIAKAGEWKLSLTNKGTAPVRVILQIQRGDTAPGFRNGGRQARFKGPFEPVVENGVAGQTVVPPLTNAGTNNAFANAAVFHTVGATRDVFGAEVAAPYSGEGADWTTKPKPTESISIDRAFTVGVRTSGAYSGTNVRLSGTSAAAALWTRNLVGKA